MRAFTCFISKVEQFQSISRQALRQVRGKEVQSQFTNTSINSKTPSSNSEYSGFISCCTWYNTYLHRNIHKFWYNEQHAGFPRRHIYLYLNVPTHTQRKLGVQLIMHVKNNSDKVFWTLFYHYSTIFFIFFFTDSLYYRQETIIIIHNNFFDGTKSLKFFLYTENGVTILTAVVMIKVNIFS